MRRILVAAIVGIVAVSTGAAAFSDPVADAAAARAGLLTGPDFPSGWAPKPGGASTTPSPLELGIVSTPACRSFKPLVANSKTGTHANSPDFTDGTTTISNDVVVYPTVANALKPIAAVKGPQLSTCFQRLFKAVVAAKLKSAGQLSKVRNLAVVVQPTAPSVSVGDDQAAFGATVSFTILGARDAVYIEDLLVRVGRATSSISYENDSSPVTDTQPAAVTASVERLQHALTG